MVDQLDARTVIAAQFPAPKSIQLTPNARTVLEKRYLRRGADGKPIETIAEMFWRVASNIAEPSTRYGEDAAGDAERFFALLTDLLFFPNSPTFTGAGTPLGQLAACFVLPITDDMGRDSRGIFSTLRTAALIQQTGGGNGFSFSRLRPRGDHVATSAGVATGPVGFLHVYDTAFGEIAQGGTRRGANMAVLRVDHPDIFEFIHCKSTEGTISNFNISVGVTDKFMRAVENDENFDLLNPRDGRVARTVGARALFDEIVKFAHHNGEPGLLFLDAANRQNPVPHLYELEATNPCITGETLIYTENGLRRADELAAESESLRVVVDGRFASPTLMRASPVFKTGIKEIYRLVTREGYELRLTADHRVMTTRGWMRAADLQRGERVHILDRRGAFGKNGTLIEGRVLGWLVGDGTMNAIRAVLSFIGEEKRELAPLFAQAVTHLVDHANQRRAYPVGVTEITERDEARVSSERLRAWAAQFGLAEDKFQVPLGVYAGSEEMQRGFLQALFTADGQVNDGGEKGCSVRLSSSHLKLLRDVQRVLLNFGIASRIYQERRRAGYREMPDGKGGKKKYFLQSQHDLAISKSNLIRFANEIGFLTEAKQMRLADYLSRMTRGPYEEKFLATIESVEFDGRESVYDLQQPETCSFIANGIVVHNCGEQWLGPYENCCLGSINLAQHVTPDDQVDWQRLRASTELATRFLDNVVDANQYVPAVPELREAALRARRIGLGIMGLGDLMYRLGVRYGSRAGEELAGQIMEFVRYYAMKASVELARQRGPFLAIKGSIYDAENLKWTPPQPTEPPSARDWGRPALDWNAIVAGVKKYGIRNAAQTTIAPTGTIATVAGTESYGCEPVFALAYTRHMNDNGADLELPYGSALFERALIDAGIDPATRAKIFADVLISGTCQDNELVPPKIRDTFVVANDITPTEHVRMQAALQAFVDNSLSKCVTGDTLVLTAHGLVPIASLSEMRLPDQFNSHDLTIVSPEGLERSDSFYYGGMRETRRVRLSYGYEIEATPNHRIHVSDADGHIRFVALDDLKVGDTVVLYGGQRIFGAPGQALPPYHRGDLGQGAWRTNVKEIRFPEKMTPELAYLLGCITSEGSIGQNSLQVCNGDRALLERLGGLFQELFGLNTHICRDNRRESVYTLQVNSRPLRNWLLSELEMEVGAQNKIIPDCILRASWDEIVAFLRGLFLDAYMTMDGRMFGIGLATRALIRQLQTVLLNLGVFASIHQSGEHAWALTVSGQALERLAEFVKFDEVWKTQRIESRGERREHHLFNYGTMLPERVTVSLRTMRPSFARSMRSLYGGQTREYQRARVNLLQGHRLERNLARRLYDHFADDTASYAQSFFSQDRDGMLYVEVESIKAGFAEVFDVSVPGSHSFIANGLCNHNTINFPETAAVEDVAQAYLLAWKLGCKGITVYVAGTREHVVLETQETALKKDSKGIEGTAEFVVAQKKPREHALKGQTYKVETPLGTAYVTVNRNGDSEPFEVFCNVGKAGSDTAAVSEAIGRMISLVLRLPSPLSPTERLEQVVEQLVGIGGARSLGLGAQRVRSLADGIAQALTEELGRALEARADAARVAPEQKPEPSRIGDLCPQCGHAALVNEEGCKKCYSCGHSEC